MLGVLRGEAIPYDRLTWDQLCDPELRVVDDGRESRSLGPEVRARLLEALVELRAFVGLDGRPPVGR